MDEAAAPCGHKGNIDQRKVDLRKCRSFAAIGIPAYKELGANVCFRLLRHCLLHQVLFGFDIRLLKKPRSATLFTWRLYHVFVR